MHPVHGEPAATGATCCTIVPPHVLSRLIEGDDPGQRSAAVQTMAATASMRTQRALLGRLARELGDEARSVAFLRPPEEARGLRQAVYDVGGGGRSQLPGQKKRGSGDPPVDDPSVNAVFDATEDAYRFFAETFDRDSIDGMGMELISTVHYSTDYDNAMWNGSQMIYGDGSGRIFKVGSLASSLTIVGHELAHGVTEHTAGLAYSSQSGALNESFSDVFGSLVEQYALGQSATEANWLIGADTPASGLGKALRSMSDPGDREVLSPQPASMSEYEDLPDDGNPDNDNGGVHINSGIPNRAFHLAATAIGGNAWEKAGKAWYRALIGGRLQPRSGFGEAAEAIVEAAGELGDPESQAAIEKAWREVGVLS